MGLFSCLILVDGSIFLESPLFTFPESIFGFLARDSVEDGCTDLLFSEEDFILPTTFLTTSADLVVNLD